MGPRRRQKGLRRQAAPSPWRAHATVAIRAALVVLLAVPIVACSTADFSAKAAIVRVPSHAAQAQVNHAVARAVADGPGTTLVFPAGKFVYKARFTARDGVNVRGAGIWRQGVAGGGGGTWLECRGMDWGSDLTVSKLLIGENAAGVSSTFQPVPRGSSSAGRNTRINGSHHVTFNYVRFKGGSDTGASLIELGNNFGNGRWSGPVCRYDMVDTTFSNCEFERPQATNAVLGRSTALGCILNIWLDCRSGGGRVQDLRFTNCHFGVRNGYHSGVDGYGLGNTVLFQPAPAEHADDGPRPSGRAVDMGFDWSRVEHCFSDVTFTRCLFEYSLWCPMDACDYARSYSLTTRFGGVVGSNPPTTAQAAAIPSAMWFDGLRIAYCYFKGSTSSGIYGTVQSEICRNLEVVDSFSGGGWTVFAGHYGNSVTGTFSNADRPRTSLFRVGWVGSDTSYTRSPFDPTS